MSIAEDKAALRQRIRALRRALTDKTALDAALYANVQAHAWVQEADLVLAYVSGQYEPDTRKLIDWLLSEGRPLALPVCEGAGEMRFYMLHSREELHPGAYGIPEPTGREPVILTERTLCIVPGLAFTEQGERLGQGGGYYDRFLQAHPGLRTMGLTYQCLMQTALPCEVHDCRVDVVITDGEQGFPNMSGGN